VVGAWYFSERAAFPPPGGAGAATRCSNSGTKSTHWRTTPLTHLNPNTPNAPRRRLCVTVFLLRCGVSVVSQRTSGFPTTGWGHESCTMLKLRHQVHTLAHNASDASQSEHAKRPKAAALRNGFFVTVWCERGVSANERLSHHRMGPGQLYNAQTPAQRPRTGRGTPRAHLNPGTQNATRIRGRVTVVPLRCGTSVSSQ